MNLDGEAFFNENIVQSYLNDTMFSDDDNFNLRTLNLSILGAQDKFKKFRGGSSNVRDSIRFHSKGGQRVLSEIFMDQNKLTEGLLDQQLLAANLQLEGKEPSRLVRSR